MPQRESSTTSHKLALPAIPPGVTVHTLENGLTIIVREDHSAPVVSAQAWCMAGSIHEGGWLGAGLSHVLEHMLFKGTQTRAGSRIDQEVQEAGGYMNAYTSFDRTVYHIDVPNTGAAVAIDILCDIMQHATLPPEEMEKEKQVIRREMDMNVDDPNRRASRRLFETAYTRSPYRFTVIGYPDIFNELKQEDILGYYRAKYAPNNVFYVVVGDVRAPEVVSKISEAYAGAKAKPSPSLVLPEEPRQTAPREIVEEASIELGYFHFAWHIPDLRHKDIPALEVLAVILGNGRSSRLYQQVREKAGLVHSVDAWNYCPGAPGLFGVSASVDPERFVQAQQAILAELQQTQDTLIPAAEISKAGKQFVSATLSSRKTMQGQAQDLGGNWLATNDLNFSHRFLEAVGNVSPADLQRVARTYFTSENRTSYALLPTGTAPKFALAAETLTDAPIRKFELGNGLRLLVKEDHRLPFVEFRAVFTGGVLAETSANCGITQLMSKVILKGTRTRSATELATTIESVGGSIDSYGGNNSFGINVEVLGEDFDLGLELLSDVILNPAFPEAALEREREVQLAGIRAQRDHLLQSAAKAMRQGLFGNVGYGLDSLGTDESVQSLTAVQVQAFHKALAVPRNCVLAVYGDVDHSNVQAAVEKAFSAWQGTRIQDGPGPASPELNKVKRMTESRDKKQAVIVMGFPGTTLRGSDRYPLELVQEACSDLGSRLFMRIREKLGLAYFVGAQNFVGLAPGYFAFYAGTEPGKTGQVEAELLAETQLLRDEGLSQEELDRAKSKIIGQKKIARQELGSFAMATALDELYGLGYSHTDSEDALYAAVTLDQIKQVCRQYLTPGKCVIAVLGPGLSE